MMAHRNKRARVFIIAEAGVNHNGSVKTAKALVDAAVRAGADAVKFQTFRADRIVTREAPKAAYQRKQGRGESQWEMLKKLELGEKAHDELFEYCGRKKIEFMSTPFDIESLELLVRLGVRRMKMPSGEITNAPLLLAAGRSGLPVILSTGASTETDVQNALTVLALGYSRKAEISAGALRKPAGSMLAALRNKVILLHCTSEYPAPYDEINLRAMIRMRETFGLRVGLSDHSKGIAVAIAAAALGACVIEKHMTLDQNMPGPDHRSSLEPSEMAELVRSVRQIEMALGSGKKTPTRSELRNQKIIRKSIVAARDISRGERFTSGNIDLKRPGTGLSPMLFWDIQKKKARRSFARNELITL